MEKMNWYDTIIYGCDHELNWFQKLIRPPLDRVDDISHWFKRTFIWKYRELKLAYQRARYGHDDNAVWNMNSWFILNAIPILTRWRKEGISYPANFSSREEWEIILEKMSTGFQHYYDCEMGDGKVDGEERLLHFETLKFAEEDRSQFYKTATRFEMTPEEEAEFQEALMLFTKYFYTLWD